MLDYELKVIKKLTYCLKHSLFLFLQVKYLWALVKQCKDKLLLETALNHHIIFTIWTNSKKNLT